MHLLDLFESTVEGYTVTRGIDRDRYQERAGLEGPFQTKSGKVVYYDKKEGQYYDPDSDMYIDHDDYRALDEGVGTYLKGAVLAGLLGLGVNQMADMASAKNSPLGQAMAQAAEQGDEYAAKHLNKLDLYMDSNDTGSIKILSKRYLNKTIESVYEEVATNKRTERILGLLRAKNPTAQNDLEALIMSFDKGQKQDREDINTLYTQNREEDQEIEALEKELERIKNKRKVSEDYYETDEQRELARMGRILMDMGKKRDDNVGKAMGRVGNELTKYGTPQGASNIKKLEKVTGQPESVIMKMMALAQKVKGDVAVGDETAGNDDEEVKEGATKKRVIKVTNIKWAAEPGVNLPSSVKITLSADIADAYEDKVDDMINDELEEKYGYSVKDFDHQFEEGYDDYLKRKIGRASDEFDVTPDNWEVKIDGKPWKVFRNKSSANQAASTIEMRYGKKTSVFATRKPVSEGIAENFDDKFSKYIGYTLGGGKPAQMLKKQVAQRQADNPDQDKGLGPSVLNIAKAREKAAKKGIRAPGNLRASPNTRDPKRLPEGWAEIDTSSLTKEPGDKIFTLTLSKTGEEYKVPGKDIIDAFQKFKELYWNKNKSLIDINDVDEFAGNRLLASKFSEALDHDIKIGDTVETKKMGQMQGVVTGFSTKYGDTRVMFKHKSGKVYATPASNLKVIDTVKKTESQVVENIDLRHNLQPGTYKHNEENITVTINSDNSVSFKQPAEWEIEGDSEYLEFVESQLADASNWTSVVDEAKKKPVPTKPDKWAYAKAQAKKKFDVYPSAYANAWAAKKYKELGGGWRMGNPKKK